VTSYAPGVLGYDVELDMLRGEVYTRIGEESITAKENGMLMVTGWNTITLDRGLCYKGLIKPIAGEGGDINCIVYHSPILGAE